MPLSTNQIIKISQLKKVGRRTLFKICEIAANITVKSDKELFDLIIDIFENNKIPNFPYFNKQDIYEASLKAEKIENNSIKEKIGIISFFDESFPKLLKNIKNPPIILNYKGDFSKLNKLNGIAIIGTREPNEKGIIAGKYFGKIFGGLGFNVVSGLAKGCDTAGHYGCIESNGTTTAILGHGLHTIYPKENVELAQSILEEGGILLSEYFWGTNAIPNYFIERDRLQSGLSVGTIVIQTGINGGTMHAVKSTIDANKPLAAIKFKDSISEKIDGNEMLIREKNAFPLTSNSIDEFVQIINKNISNQEDSNSIYFDQFNLKKKPFQQEKKDNNYSLF